MKYKNNLYRETKNTFKRLYYKTKRIFKLYWNIRIVKIRKAEISTSIIYVDHVIDFEDNMNDQEQKDEF